MSEKPDLARFAGHSRNHGDALTLRPTLGPNEFAEEFLKLTLYGYGPGSGRGFASPIDLQPLRRIYGSWEKVTSYLEEVAPRLDATYLKVEDGTKTYCYLVSNRLVEAIESAQPKDEDELKFVLQRLGYSSWIRPSEARGLVEGLASASPFSEEMLAFACDGDADV